MVAVSSTPIPQSLLATSAAALASDAGSVGTHGARSAWGSPGQWRFETPNRDAGSAAGSIGHSPQPAPFASMMIKLLGRAVAALDSDVAVAKANALMVVRETPRELKSRQAWRQGVLIFDHTTLAESSGSGSRSALNRSWPVISS